MRRSFFAKVALAILVSLGATFALASQARSLSPERFIELGLDAAEGEYKAPDFRLETIDQGEVSLSEHRGQVVLVNFWTTW